MSYRSAVPPAVKRAVHLGSRTFGRLTAEHRMLPSLLICGGQRCGTTSLYHALRQHPAILKAVLHKGVHYFDTDYHRGIGWYRAHFPLLRTAEQIHRRDGIAPIAFESSPYYLYHPLAGERIARDLADVKLIALVRDPVERAYSQHAHEVARGFESEADFAAALALEDQRTEGEAERLAREPDYHSHSYRHHAYRARGRYADHLERLESAVGRQRLLVIDSHDFFTGPQGVYRRVLDFLGLSHRGDPGFERHNARARPAPMPQAVRRELTEHFRPYDERLSAWLGREPSWRRR